MGSHIPALLLEKTGDLNMKYKAKQLWIVIDTICGGYYIYKDEKVIEKAKQAAKQVQEYCDFFLHGNHFGMNEEEYRDLCSYVIHVLKDFVEALEQEDTVLMLDTLDYGLRELVNLYHEKDVAAV